MSDVDAPRPDSDQPEPAEDVRARAHADLQRLAAEATGLDRPAGPIDRNCGGADQQHAAHVSYPAPGVGFRCDGSPRPQRIDAAAAGFTPGPDRQVSEAELPRLLESVRLLDQLAGVAYRAYCDSTGGRSAVTGVRLPAYADQSDPIRAAWRAAARAVVLAAAEA